VRLRDEAQTGHGESLRAVVGSKNVESSRGFIELQESLLCLRSAVPPALLLPPEIYGT
jgi:hypothetical protein